MPQIFRIGEYWVYFWTNENEPLEPVHVHISKGRPAGNATKVWITRRGNGKIISGRLAIIAERLEFFGGFKGDNKGYEKGDTYEF